MSSYVAVVELGEMLFMVTAIALTNQRIDHLMEGAPDLDIFSEVGLQSARRACREEGVSLTIRCCRRAREVKGYIVFSLFTRDSEREEVLRLLVDGSLHQLHAWGASPLNAEELEEALAVKAGWSVVRLVKPSLPVEMGEDETLALSSVNGSKALWSSLLAGREMIIDFGIFPLTISDLDQMLWRTVAASQVFSRRDLRRAEQFRENAELASQASSQGLLAGLAITLIGEDCDSLFAHLLAFQSPFFGTSRGQASWVMKVGNDDVERAGFMALDYSEEALQENHLEPDGRLVFELAQTVLASGANFSGVGLTEARSQWLPGQEGRFDVFLSHNSRDKTIIRRLADTLEALGIRVWLDERELVPGQAWQDGLEEIVRSVRSAAVLVGSDGLGPWEIHEMRMCLMECVARGLPVIPVLLPGAARRPDLPLFLRQFTWVDLRGGLKRNGIERLIWGITGKKVES